MKSILFIKACLILSFLTFMFAGLRQPVSQEQQPLGEWMYIIKNTPNGSYSGVMSLSKIGGRYAGDMISAMGHLELDDVHINANMLSCSFKVRDKEFKVNGFFRNDSFIGNVVYDNNSYPLDAKRANR